MFPLFILISILIMLGLSRTLRAMLGVMTAAPLPVSPIRMANAVITGQIARMGAFPVLGLGCEERCGNEREYDNEDTHRTLLALVERL